MKFFNKFIQNKFNFNLSKLFIIDVQLKFLKKTNNKFLFSKKFFYTYSNIVSFFFKDGLLLKYLSVMSSIISIYNFEKHSLKDEVFIGKKKSKKNLFMIINDVIKLIQPPFIFQTVTVPKKLKRKIKLKYLIKIVYKNESLRRSVAIKQLFNNCNNFSDTTLNIRFYKSIMHTLIQGKDSTLYKKSY